MPSWKPWSSLALMAAESTTSLSGPLSKSLFAPISLEVVLVRTLPSKPPLEVPRRQPILSDLREPPCQQVEAKRRCMYTSQIFILLGRLQAKGDVSVARYGDDLVDS